ncbi:MAG: hypothetical protein ACOY94_18410 [Bacillota bacterium]
MQHLYTSERYLRLIEVTRRGDLAARRALYEEAVAETEGAERALWMLLRAGALLGYPVVPVDRIRTEVGGALALAPEDPEVRMFAVLSMINLVMVTERPCHLKGWWRLIPKVVRQTQDPWQVYHSLGMLAWSRQRLPLAMRHFNRVLAEMAAWTPDRMQAFRGRYFLASCFRALIALEMGQVALAEQDVARALDLSEHISKIYVSDRPLRIAQAGLALSRGDFQGARWSLQQIRAKEKEERYSRDSYPLKVEMELMAARIALAEGNRQAFEHFCGRALALAKQHNFPMTARRIAAVRLKALAETVGVAGSGYGSKEGG